MKEDTNTNTPENANRGRFGDTTQRCGWCGKPTTFGQRYLHSGGDKKNYCSFSCSAAGDFYANIVLSIITSIVAYFLSYMILVPLPQTLETGAMIAIVLFVSIAIFYWIEVAVGWKIRRRKSDDRWT